VAVKKVLGERGTLLTSRAVTACYRDYNQVRQCCFIADAHARCATRLMLGRMTQHCSLAYNLTGCIMLIANRLKELRLEGYDADYLVTLGTQPRSSHCTHYSHAVTVALHCKHNAVYQQHVDLCFLYQLCSLSLYSCAVAVLYTVYACLSHSMLVHI
jgi:hypothetical protein